MGCPELIISATQPFLIFIELEFCVIEVCDDQWQLQLLELPMSIVVKYRYLSFDNGLCLQFWTAVLDISFVWI